MDSSLELTTATIETCPPSPAPYPLDRLLEVRGIRSIDLHRYRARLNLRPGSDPDAIVRRVSTVLAEAWGAPSRQRDEPVRAFPVAYRGSRRVAESPAMAGSQPVLRALFEVRGVAEAILEPDRVRVRLGALFAWTEVQPEIARALRDAG